MTDPDLAVQFWSAIGGESIDVNELQVGEVFLLERGKMRAVCRLTGKVGDEFIFVPAPDVELGKNYKVLVLAK